MKFPFPKYQFTVVKIPLLLFEKIKEISAIEGITPEEAVIALLQGGADQYFEDRAAKKEGRTIDLAEFYNNPPRTRSQIRKKWSSYSDACLHCGSDEKKHYAKGYCHSCYNQMAVEKRYTKAN